MQAWGLRFVLMRMSLWPLGAPGRASCLCPACLPAPQQPDKTHRRRIMVRWRFSGFLSQWQGVNIYMRSGFYWSASDYYRYSVGNQLDFNLYVMLKYIILKSEFKETCFLQVRWFLFGRFLAILNSKEWQKPTSFIVIIIMPWVLILAASPRAPGQDFGNLWLW